MSPIASTSSSLFCLMLFLLTFFVSISFQDGSRQLGNKHAAIFVFGDSLYDPGNNNYLNVSIDSKANYQPYGETFFYFPTGRFCDGRQIPDFAAMYANLPIWEPYLQPGRHNFTNGASFASAGAGVLVSSDPTVLSLVRQLSYFKEVANLLKEELGDTEAKNILKNAIYLSSIGGVDCMAFGVTYTNATELQMQEHVDLVIGNLAEVIEEIHEMGGRKFAFQNVAPLGCSPESKQSFNSSGDDACVEKFQILASLYNKALSSVAKKLQSQLPGFTYLIFDFFNALNDMTSYPKKYGFKVSDIACCGTGSHRASGCGLLSEEYELCTNPNDYVYFDGGHPTERANSILAEMLWNGETNATWPLNMKQLYELESSFDENASNGGGLFSDG